MGGGKKCLCVVVCFFVFCFCCPEDREFVEKMRFVASYSMSNKLLLTSRHIMTTGLKKCL